MRYYYFAQSLFSSPTGSDLAATQRWRNTLERVRAEAVRDGCPNPPPEMRAILRISNSHDNLSTRSLTRLIPALQTWNEVMTSDEMDTYLHRDAYCVEHRDDIARATYTIETRYTATGKDLWVDLAVENLTDHRLFGGVYGGARLVGSTDRRQLQGATSYWGGSSADGWGARAHATVHKQLLDVIGQPFHVTAEGQLTDVRVALYTENGGHACTFPAVPLS